MSLSFLLYGALYIKLILVRDYLSCRIQMYLNHVFHSNPTSNSRFRYLTVDFLYLFLQGYRNTLVFILSKLTGHGSGFLVNLLITTIWESNHFLPTFFVSTSSIPYPCCYPFLIPVLIPLWESQESLSFLMKVLRFGKLLKFNGLQVCYSVFQ